MRVSFFLYLILIWGCGQKISSTSAVMTRTSNFQSSGGTADLNGVWWSSDTIAPSARFVFDGTDSVYYPDLLQKFLYHSWDDTLVIKYSEEVDTFNFFRSHDTLVLTGPYGIDTFTLKH